jgi:hypothetical protein
MGMPMQTRLGMLGTVVALLSAGLAAPQDLLDSE